MTQGQKQQAKYYILCIEHGLIDQKEIINWANSIILNGIQNHFIIEISTSKRNYEIKSNLNEISKEIKWDGISESFLINQILNIENHRSLNLLFRKFWHDESVSDELISALYHFDHLVDDCYNMDTKSDEDKLLQEIIQICKKNCALELLKDEKKGGRTNA